MLVTITINNNKKRKLLVILLAFTPFYLVAQTVNVFLGTSGDHGQLSPAASYPFSMLSIGPQTYPVLHAGYEYKAQTFLGFTHNRFEGVGCRGSGGNILIKPFLDDSSVLIKKKDEGSPGYYSVIFQNGIRASFVVHQKQGIEKYQFPSGKNGLAIDLSFAFANRFIREEHRVEGSAISGWIESGTTCRMGVYRVYYFIKADQPIEWKQSSEHKLISHFNFSQVSVRVGFSSLSTDYAKASITNESFTELRSKSAADWKVLLNDIEVKGDPKKAELFYSLLYRTLQSPYRTTEKGEPIRYNGWSVWDNYKTQLPLLSLAYSRQYEDIITSLADLYRNGKQDWARMKEPTNSVRTEHSIVVLLDAYRKAYPVNFAYILDSLIAEAGRLDFSHPDKALESSYDLWAVSQVLEILHKDSLSLMFKRKAGEWKNYWNKDFKKLDTSDVDKLETRDMYQGTIWQYRWFAPFDQKKLIELCGGEKQYLDQLDAFFKGDYYNAANEPDIQVPYMYQFTSEPWKSQEVIHKYAHDTVVQYYTDLNLRGIDPQVQRVYNNRPDAYLRSMDDDGGAMSGWYVLAAIGLSPACVGWPVWYLHVPLFPSVTLNNNGKRFTIVVKNFAHDRCYIQSAIFNGKALNRIWLTHKEISSGGTLVIIASDHPNKTFGISNRWITELK
jgi:putative alpha-1,2-mannosidase